MLRVRLLTKDYHTFQPFIKSAQQLYDNGIELVQPNDTNFDISLIGHSLFQDKKIGSLKKSTEMGLEFLSKVKGPYILVDGQDSYKPENFDDYKDRIVLSGTNWIGVPDIQWYDYSKIEKLFDVSAMFQHPHSECHEFDLKPSQDFYYNEHRQPVLDKIKYSPFMVAKLYKGRRVPNDVYYRYIQSSKVLLAPFGYGEMAPRDLESAQIGSLLIKPNMNHIDTYPNIYIKDKTYISCNWDYSDLEDKIQYAVENFDAIRNEFVNNLRKRYTEEYHEYYLADYIKNLFSKMGIL